MQTLFCSARLYHRLFHNIANRYSLRLILKLYNFQYDIGERELTDVLNAGNTVFVLLSDLKQLNLNTDHLLNFFDSKPKRAVTNYDVFPYPIQIVSSTGTSMKLCQDQSLLGEYWQHFGAESEYRVYLHESDQFSPSRYHATR